MTDALANTIPVLNLGQPEAVQSVTAAAAAEWLVVALLASRRTTVERLRLRGSLDTDERMAVWNATPRFPRADMEVSTEQHTPAEAAELIRSHMFENEGMAQPRTHAIGGMSGCMEAIELDRGDEPL